MTAPNMERIIGSLERTLQNSSLNNNQRRSAVNEVEGIERSSSPDNHNDNNIQNGDATLELNSYVSHLKIGEIYYINWRNGIKEKEDPRTTAESSGDFYCYSEEEDEEDDSLYDSEESSSESSQASSSKEHNYQSQNNNNNNNNNNVLVVAGCKSCLMYFMVPKQVEDCPKCSNGQLLHFGRSENGSP